MIRTYSKARDGSKKLSANFTVAEFYCHDGSDVIVVDDALVALIQKIRDHFGRAVNITSAYRTAAWNKKQGGAQNSYHSRGMAADIQIAGVSPIAIALYAQSIGAGGIGLYLYSGGMFVHVDNRSSKTRWVQATKSGGYTVVASIFPTLKTGSKGDAVRLMQRGIGCKEDGVFGKKDTETTLKAYQKKNGLDDDGVCGSMTWVKIQKNLGA